MKTTNSWINLWRQPLLIGILSMTGLVSALVGDGVFDIMAWLCLLYPLIKLCYHYGQKTSINTSSSNSSSQQTIDELTYTGKG